jgi:hypothetical protein
MKPPPLPEETLVRVLRISKMNGLSVLIIAGLGALVSLASWDPVGVMVGGLVAYGGWMELSGRKHLLRGEAAEGMRRLVRSQWIVLGVILVYCVTRLASFDSESALGPLTSEMRAQLAEAGVDLASILPMIRLAFYGLYGSVALVTLIYQGGMARYYRRRTDVVKQAVEARLRPPPVVLPVKTGPDPEDLLT